MSNDEKFNTWLLSTTSKNTYKVLFLSGKIDRSTASNDKRINPVIYLTNKSIILTGRGTSKKPYVVK